MKINIVPLFIAIAISALLSYALYCMAVNVVDAPLLAIAGFIDLGLPLAAAMSFSVENERATFNIKVLSIVFFIILLIINLIFGFIYSTFSTYLIINGLLLLVWILIVYSISKSKQ